jgi:hypothetical protein
MTIKQYQIIRLQLEQQNKDFNESLTDLFLNDEINEINFLNNLKFEYQ